MNNATGTGGRGCAMVLAATLTAALTGTAAAQAQTPAAPATEGEVPMSPEQLLAPPVEEVPRGLTVGAGAEAAGNREDLGLRQESWERPEGNMGPGQQRPGYRLTRLRPTQHRDRLRAHRNVDNGRDRPTRLPPRGQAGRRRNRRSPHRRAQHPVDSPLEPGTRHVGAHHGRDRRGRWSDLQRSTHHHRRQGTDIPPMCG